jgi:hypothetical protein
VYVAEEDNDVAVHVPVCMDIAEEADSVVNRSVGGDFDVVKKLDRVIVGARGCGRNRQSGAEKANGEKSTVHRCLIPATTNYTRSETQKFQRGFSG